MNDLEISQKIFAIIFPAVTAALSFCVDGMLPRHWCGSVCGLQRCMLHPHFNVSDDVWQKFITNFVTLVVGQWGRSRFWWLHSSYSKELQRLCPKCRPVTDWRLTLNAPSDTRIWRTAQFCRCQWLTTTTSILVHDTWPFAVTSTFSALVGQTLRLHHKWSQLVCGCLWVPSFEPEGVRGRPKKNWMEGIKAMNDRNLNEGQWEDRKQRSLVVGQRRKTFWTRYIHTLSSCCWWFLLWLG